jgi:hypothetical protein
MHRDRTLRRVLFAGKTHCGIWVRDELAILVLRKCGAPVVIRVSRKSEKHVAIAGDDYAREIRRCHAGNYLQRCSDWILGKR